ncbi:MAG: hypothetical protein DMG40_03910 [Acidobacteria bacterium]|nr:MAG: hypothetical protein DMG40_03910 [Acidobacteriota bacterium]
MVGLMIDPLRTEIRYEPGLGAESEEKSAGALSFGVLGRIAEMRFSQSARSGAPVLSRERSAN